MLVYSGSRTGRKHAENQDSIGVRELSASRCLLVVSDGISSHAYGGSVARWIVEKHLMVDAIPDSLGDYLAELHAKFYRDFDDVNDMLESGASVSLVDINKNVAEIYWAGDSPVFHTRQTPSPLTTLIAKPHSGASGALTSCFVGTRPFAPSHSRVELQGGDVLTLASDGFVVDAASLSYEASHGGFSQAKIDTLLDWSVSEPGSDDASVICYVHGALHAA